MALRVLTLFAHSLALVSAVAVSQPGTRRNAALNPDDSISRLRADNNEFVKYASILEAGDVMIEPLEGQTSLHSSKHSQKHNDKHVLRPEADKITDIRHVKFPRSASSMLISLVRSISRGFSVRQVPPDFQSFWSTITGGQPWPDRGDGSDQSPLPSQFGATVTSQPSTSNYVFDPMAHNLNSVYYSQTDLTATVPFSQICADPAIDIVILASVTDFFSAGGYPTLNMGSHCWAPNAAQAAAGATGLIDCVGDGFAAQVTTCQDAGKKVMLSVGGAISDTTIPSEDKAKELADMLWGLFLGGSDNQTLQALRPFGESVILDGVDIDNENPANSPHLPTLVSSLRDLFAADPSNKPYYLSAAPQCPRPDGSIPIPLVIDDLDFVGVQFYNNPSCDFSSGTSFLNALQAWSTDLETARAFRVISNGVTSPRLLVGVPAFAAGGSGYVPAGAGFEAVLDAVKALDLKNIGGLSYWDGAYQEVSAQAGGETFAQIVRRVLA